MSRKPRTVTRPYKTSGPKRPFQFVFNVSKQEKKNFEDFAKADGTPKATMLRTAMLFYQVHHNNPALS